MISCLKTAERPAAVRSSLGGRRDLRHTAAFSITVQPSINCTSASAAARSSTFLHGAAVSGPEAHGHAPEGEGEQRTGCRPRRVPRSRRRGVHCCLGGALQTGSLQACVEETGRAGEWNTPDSMAQTKSSPSSSPLTDAVFTCLTQNPDLQRDHHPGNFSNSARRSSCLKTFGALPQ